VAGQGSLIVSVRILNVICDGVQYRTRRYLRDPAAGIPFAARFGDGGTVSAEDKTETIVSRSLLDGKSPGEFRGNSVALW
jgi:hypothetical protein